jgi:malonyl CoA-acyl carrier protein transacylase
MAEADSAFSDILRDTDFRQPKIPVVPNSLGSPISDPDELKSWLITQIVSPVRWVATIESLIEEGVDSFLECWPKPYLSNMVKKCLPPGSKATVQVVA